MKIVNLDAPKHLARKVVELEIPNFIVEVVRHLERNCYVDLAWRLIRRGVHSSHNTTLPLSPIWKFEDTEYENIATLIHTIPIYLRDSKPEEIRDENSIIDLLGAYYSNRKGDSPYIELFLSAIDNSINNDENHFKWLFTKVLIHELAHAALDIFNLEGNNSVIEKIHYFSEFGRWREESMANAVTLRIIRDYGNKDFYDYVKQFMQSQPAEYALGVLMEDFGWWDFISVFDSKEQGVDSNLQQKWLNYVKGTPDWDGLNKWNDILRRKYVYVFEGKYYTSEEELVYDIVEKVLSDYEHQNGGKMPFATFSTLFPYIRTDVEMSYEPAQKVVGDSRYDKEFELADGNYSLYYIWDNESLHNFIDMNKLNVNIIEYKNY
jgi:predicted Zn-dependent protease with MMP-like domain